MFKKYPAHVLMLVCMGFGYLLLSYYNALLDDDIVMLRSVREQGIIGATIGQYESWNTRWMSFLFLHSWMYFWNEDSSPLLYHLFTLTTLLCSFRRLARGLSAKGLINPAGKAEIRFYAALMTAALLAATYHIGDTWFWVNTSTMYGWNLTAIVCTLSLVLLPLKNSLLQDIFISLAGLYVGGAAEPAVACLLILLPSLLFFKKELSPSCRRDITHFLIGMMVSFGIALVGEGHGRRAAALPDLPFITYLWKSAYFSAKIAWYHSPLRVLMVLVLLLPLFSKLKNEPDLRPLQTALLALSAWIGVILIHTFFITWIMGDYGPERAWSFISLWTVLVAGWWWYKSGTRLMERAGHLPSWAACLVIAWVLFVQLRVLPAYHDYVKSVRNKEQHFDPEKIPDSGLLHRMNSI